MTPEHDGIIELLDSQQLLLLAEDLNKIKEISTSARNGRESWAPHLAEKLLADDDY